MYNCEVTPTLFLQMHDCVHEDDGIVRAVTLYSRERAAASDPYLFISFGKHNGRRHVVSVKTSGVVVGHPSRHFAIDSLLACPRRPEFVLAAGSSEMNSMHADLVVYLQGFVTRTSAYAGPVLLEGMTHRRNGVMTACTVAVGLAFNLSNLAVVATELQQIVTGLARLPEQVRANLKCLLLAPEAYVGLHRSIAGFTPGGRALDTVVGAPPLETTLLRPMRITLGGTDVDASDHMVRALRAHDTLRVISEYSRAKLGFGPAWSQTYLVRTSGREAPGALRVCVLKRAPRTPGEANVVPAPAHIPEFFHETAVYDWCQRHGFSPVLRDNTDELLPIFHLLFDMTEEHARSFLGPVLHYASTEDKPTIGLAFDYDQPTWRAALIDILRPFAVMPQAVADLIRGFVLLPNLAHGHFRLQQLID